MTLSHSPNIVRDGLVLYLDAANPKSYPGSGTTWYDLSGNNRNFTLVGPPALSNGAFDITGDSTYASLNDPTIVPRTNDFTYSTWLNFDSFDIYDTIFEHGSWSDTLLFRYQNNSSVAVYAENALRGSFSWVASANTWYNIVFTRSSGTANMYVNSTITGTSFSMTTDINLSNTTIFLMRSQHTTSQFLNGQISNFSIYSHALSDIEIKQNFNALRGRYGI